MARPKRGDFATGAEGQARYRKAVQTWLKNKKAATEKANKITSTKKNIEKQKKPTIKKTATKAVKELAKKKTTSATKKTSTTKKTTTTKQTVKPSTTKTRATTVKPKTNQRLKAVKDFSEKTYKGTKKVVGKRIKQTQQFARKQAPKVQSWKKTLKAGLKQKNPPAETRPQKVVQSMNQGLRKARVLGTKYMKKNKPIQTAAKSAWEGIKADKGKSAVKGLKNLGKGYVAYTIGEKLINTATEPVTSRIKHRIRNYIRRTEYGKKPLTLQESKDLEAKFDKMSHAEQKAALKKQKEARKTYLASKKSNKTKNTNTNLKINKSEDYLGNNNKKNNKSSSKTSNIPKPIVRSVGKTDYNIATEGGKKAYENALHKSKSLPSSEGGKYVKAPKKERLTGRAKLRAENIRRFGKPHVDRLIKKNNEFQEIKRIKDRNERKKRREEYRQKYGR